MKIVQNSLLPGVKNKTVLRVRDFSKKECIARVLHLGAGRQSSTIAEMTVNGDLPPLDFAIFANTKNEPGWVYDQVEYLKSRLSVVIVEKSENGIVWDTKFGNGRFASMPFFTKDAIGNVGRLRRQCTKEYKIDPINSYLLDWLIERGYGFIAQDGSRRILKDIYIESWFGISYDEIQRLKDRAGPWQRDIYPLIDKKMSLKMCLNYLRENDHPVPGKSSCKICAFHDDKYWQELKDDHPGYFGDACDFDEWIRGPEGAKRLTLNLKSDCFLHRSCVPLREIDFENQPLAIPMFCEADCFT